MLLYIHIPFCDSKCYYCSFNSYTDILYLKEEYFKALKKQLLFELKRFNLKKLTSIYIGGGTPSAVNANLYEDIFKTLTPFITSDTEITTEANPNSLTNEWIKDMKSFGVNRVSLGVQSFDDKKLRFLGRNHNSLEAKKAIETSLNYIDNLSIDLIYDTILDNKNLLKNDLKTAFSFPITHLSSYSLTIEKGTTFFKKQNLTKDDQNLSVWFINQIKNSGFLQYEISNFAKKKSIHNLGYWQGKDYIGVGSGAVGFLKNKRFYPTKNVKEYIKNPLKIEVENLTIKNLIDEKIFLGLRSEVGVDIKLLDNKKVKILLDEDKVILKNNRIFNKDYFLADTIALFLMQD